MVAFGDKRFLEGADRIGNTLVRDAFWDGDRCTWLGWVDSYEKKKLVPKFTSCGPDVYSGTSGIATFIANLYRFSQDRQHLRVLEGAVNQVMSLQEDMIARGRYGIYFGVGGMALSFLRIGQCLDRPELIKRGMALLKLTNEFDLSAELIDIIVGSAGLILALLWAARHFQEPELLQIAVKHGNFLLQKATRDQHGISWVTFVNAKHQNLTGYAHGVSGIVHALLELYEATSEVRFKDAAIEGLQYEAHWFSDQKKNWVDLRSSSGESILQNNSELSCAMGWCHGAPGIGLSRLRITELLPDDLSIKTDLEAAITTTASSLAKPWAPGVGNYSLCHGAAGNADFMLMAGQQLKRPELTALAEKVGQEGIEFYVKQGLPWPCGNGGAGETPNLMLGTAGIGYFYLRLYAPEMVPSVLLISS